MNEILRLLSIDPQLAPTLWPMVIAWIFIFGSAIGSFLNVVIYRLPEGKSLSHPGSRCPKCRHSIRGYDNIPILSWLILRAKCRDCKAPISARYPLVEAFVAVMFVLVAVAGPLSGNVNTPSNWGQYAQHITALCVLFSAALIHYDRKPLPRGLVVFALVVGFLSVMLWPVRPDWAIGGVILGATLGRLARPAARGIVCDHPNDPIWLMLIVGLFFGWQSVAIVAISVAIADLLIVLAGLGAGALASIPRSGVCFMATLAIVLASHRLHLLLNIGPDRDGILLLTSIAMTAICGLIARQLTPKASVR